MPSQNLKDMSLCLGMINGWGFFIIKITHKGMAAVKQAVVKALVVQQIRMHVMNDLSLTGLKVFLTDKNKMPLRSL